MTDLGFILLAIIRLYTIVLVIRIIIEMVQSFSRQFNPPRWFMIMAEPLFVVTDPPVRLLRRIVPPLRMGGVALDMSVIVLFLILSLLSAVISVTMLR